MKNSIKTAVKGALLAGMAAAAVGSAQAQLQNPPYGGAYVSGDFVAGFTTGTGSELIVNLGNTLVNGEQWNLDTLLTGSTGSGDAGLSLNSLKWGVIGINSGKYFSTVAQNPAASAGTAAKGYLTGMFTGGGSSAIPSGQGYVVDAANGNQSWFNNVDTFNSGQATSPYGELGSSADSTTASSGSFSEFANWYANGGGSSTLQSLGFTFDSTGTLTYGTVSVPEPATYGMLSGAGLLLLAIRRQLVRA